ncbi:MAG: nucleosome assembly protein 1-like 1 [Bacillariaceae sp.]|jgi:nucleosome assembly protein 1-like 1
MTDGDKIQAEMEKAGTTTTMIDEDKIQAEMEKAKDMKISELKMKLMAKGVLTSSFLEKNEFIRAYAEAVVKDSGKQPLQSLSTEKNGFSFTPFGGGGGDGDGVDENDNSDDEDEDPTESILENLPQYIKHRVEKLKEINNEREELMKEYLEERANLETKYQLLSQPLYEKRKDVVLGQMDEDIDNTHETNDCIVDGDIQPKEKGIPQFWACTINQMPVTEGILPEKDFECLGYLEDIRCFNYENGEGFRLEFHFAPNDYFENSVLTKSYDVPNLLLGDEPILKNVEGCEIIWKPSKSLTYIDTTKQQRGKGKNSGQIRTVTKKERCDSFFHFFTPPKMPSLDSMDEAEAVRLEAAFDEDYDVAQAFRSHIIPNAAMWFSGDAMEKEMEAAMEGMEWPTGDNSPPSEDEDPECK